MPQCDVKKDPRNPVTSPEAERFTGYNLPMQKLDDGFEYYVIGPHPSLINQPLCWQEPAFEVGIDTVGGHVDPIFSREAPTQSSVRRARKIASSTPQQLDI